MLILRALVDCAKCGETYEGTWTDDSLSVQDMAEPPEEEQECPACGNVQLEVFPGWCFNSEAG
jgi:Zn finger protein HypA/HybF involved in hydrogenase expression